LKGTDDAYNCNFTFKYIYEKKGRNKMSKKIIAIIITIIMCITTLSLPVYAGDGDSFNSNESCETEGVYDYGEYGDCTITSPVSGGTDITSTYRIAGNNTDSYVYVTILSSAAVYYGPSTSYVLRETLTYAQGGYAIERSGSYYLVQYTKNGVTTRGYILSTSLSGSLSSVSYENNNINILGINTYGSTVHVYGGPGTTYADIGTISNRELITVLKAENSSWYHIEYYTSSGNKRGYVSESYILIPQYGYNKPITSGYRTKDYSGSHNGIDIGGVGTTTSVYAITNGSAEYLTRHENDPEEGLVMVSYGNYIKLTCSDTGIIAYYAHLSIFRGGFTYLTYPNPDEPRGISVNTIEISRGTLSVAAGLYLGRTGSTGNSTGNHLHFEVRAGNDSTILDPFTYVLFPNMPY